MPASAESTARRSRFLDLLTRHLEGEAEALLADAEGSLMELEPSSGRGGPVEVEAWLRRHLGVSLKRAVRAEQKPRSEDEVVTQAVASIRRIVHQQRDERSTLAPLVAPVLSSPPDRRWQMVTSLPELRRTWFVSSLLDGADLLAEEAGPEVVEELALATLHLAERLSIRTNRRALVFDLFAQAWLLRVRVALERSEREDAAFALELAQLYQERGTGDPLLLFATARATAWLVWWGGDLELAAECFRVMARRSEEVKDPALVAEARAWQAVLKSARAGSAIEPSESSSTPSVLRVEKTARRLHLPGV